MTEFIVFVCGVAVGFFPATIFAYREGYIQALNDARKEVEQMLSKWRDAQ